MKILNAAYNTYEAMLKENEYGVITGNIVNTKGKALSGVKIEIYFRDDLIGEIKTDKNGRYETGITPNKEGYKLKITKEYFVKNIDITEANFRKYRNTYNSSGFKSDISYQCGS